MSRTSSQSSCTRIQDPQWVSIGRRISADVKVPRLSLVRHFCIFLLAFQVGVVVDEIIPPCPLIFGGLQLQCRSLHHGCIALVVSSIEEKDLVSGDSKPCYYWTTSWT